MASLKVIHCLPQLAALSVCVAENGFGRQKGSHSFPWDRFSVKAVRCHWICTLYFVVVNRAGKMEGSSVHFNFHVRESPEIKVDFKQKHFAALTKFASLCFCPLFSFSACFAYIIHILSCSSQSSFLSSHSHSFLDNSLPLILHLLSYT